MNYEYEESTDLREIASALVAKFSDVEHIDVEEVLFLSEKVSTTSAFARCYSLDEHPIAFFTDKKYCIVVYEANCEHFSRNQRVLLVYHEIKHIGRKKTLIDHNVKDFRSILAFGLDWHQDGAEVPDILGDDYAAMD